MLIYAVLTLRLSRSDREDEFQNVSTKILTICNVEKH